MKWGVELPQTHKGRMALKAWVLSWEPYNEALKRYCSNDCVEVIPLAEESKPD